jgi:hypothetical protein
MWGRDLMSIKQGLSLVDRVCFSALGSLRAQPWLGVHPYVETTPVTVGQTL